MECAQCGTEIAANALICYRCGAATDDASRPDPPPAAPGRPWAPILLGVVLLLAAAFFGLLASGGQPVSPAVWFMLGAAGILLLWRLRR